MLMPATESNESAGLELPASLDYAEIRIRSQARLFGYEPDDDPALVRVEASITIRDFSDDELLDNGHVPIAEIDGIGLSTVRVDGDPEITILRAEGLILDLF